MFSDTDKSRLIEAMRRTGTTRLEVECGGEVLTLGVALDAPVMAAAPVEKAAQIAVKSPALGRFVACGADDGLAAVLDGDHISAGQVLGYVELDGARVQVTAPKCGVLIGDGPRQGQTIGYGDPLFKMEADT
ncbi:acetyl-CoA carboxylase biotin carboxyl carrier protein [Primorskyibacter flagellatus]|uniref:acetyl-CoA carboxylase biotin carboxyl carrier protein n=1 Tax=Primorskyibacter flagellatus TaxID=1387277 RepID=UPI003A90D3FD